MLLLYRDWRRDFQVDTYYIDEQLLICAITCDNFNIIEEKIGDLDRVGTRKKLKLDRLPGKAREIEFQ